MPEQLAFSRCRLQPFVPSLGHTSIPRQSGTPCIQLRWPDTYLVVGRILVRRRRLVGLLAALHLLLLLSVFLLHLLGLLLMFLFHLLLRLLLSRGVLILFLQILMLLILLLLKFLVFLCLLIVELLLLLLVFLIRLGVPGVRKRRALVRLEIVRMHSPCIHIGIRVATRIAICASRVVR